MADGEGEPGVFRATALPGDPRLLPTVTNAFLGTRVFRDILHAAGVYSGAAGDTHRADVPSPLGLRMAAPGARSPAESFTLDTWTGERGAAPFPSGSAGGSVLSAFAASSAQSHLPSRSPFASGCCSPGTSGKFPFCVGISDFQAVALSLLRPGSADAL